MPGEIKLPGVGNVKKSTALIGGAAVLGIVAFAYIRHRNSSAAAASSSGGTVTDPAGNVCQSLDPASGYCVGSPEDEQFQQQYSAGLGDSGVGYNPFTSGFITDAMGNTCTALDPATGLCPVSQTGGANGGVTTSVTTNAQWVQQAEEQLGNTSTIQAALGYALSGSPVTQAQKNIFMEAVGLLGPPPQGYPPLNVTGSAGQSPTPSKTVTVPVTFGDSANEAISKVEAAGLKAKTSPTRNPRNEYTSTGSSPEGGKKVAKNSTVTIHVKVSKAGK